MKVLGILGSPRKGGNSELLLDKVLSGARSKGYDTEKLALGELKFSPCTECGGCDETGVCVIEDDLQPVYQKLDQARAVIIASPIFFGSLPAQVKAMIDRYQCRWVRKFVLGKQGRPFPQEGYLILVSGANRDKFFKNAESIVKNFFAVLNIKFKGYLYCPGIDEKGKVLEHPDYLNKAYELGKKIIARR
ncbi:MAG: flavodoxin family protein [Omnitrophica bacterium]|nr:flavodoxin family protein [Candidatus Omnitrophota bacterium]